MKIVSVRIDGLFSREKPIKLDFHPDLNILTGRNGTGKTTIMKLIWYIMSGQIVRALTEITFSRVQVTTTAYDVLVTRVGDNTCKVRWTVGDKTTDYRDTFDDETGDLDNAEDIPNSRMKRAGKSVFFPTFRRIEGGFFSNETSRNLFADRTQKARGDLEEALGALSARLSSPNHQFVSALSTSDIESLLLRQYTEASEAANKAQETTSQLMIQEIKEFKKEKSEGGQGSHINQEIAAEGVLDVIKGMIENMEKERERALSQYNAIRELVLKIIRHSGIKMGRLSFGDAAAAINSTALSAGEKQMLSFICYNAFYEKAVFFIDEPELSLHVDWQRQLFPTLFHQKKDNQFIIATHSPFIYSRYPDREIMLTDDRGDSSLDELSEI